MPVLYHRSGHFPQPSLRRFRPHTISGDLGWVSRVFRVLRSGSDKRTAQQCAQIFVDFMLDYPHEPKALQQRMPPGSMDRGDPHRTVTGGPQVQVSLCPFALSSSCVFFLGGGLGTTHITLGPTCWFFSPRLLLQPDSRRAREWDTKQRIPETMQIVEGMPFSGRCSMESKMTATIFGGPPS